MRLLFGVGGSPVGDAFSAMLLERRREKAFCDALGLPGYKARKRLNHAQKPLTLFAQLITFGLRISLQWLQRKATQFLGHGDRIFGGLKTDGGQGEDHARLGPDRPLVFADDRQQFVRSAAELDHLLVQDSQISFDRLPKVALGRGFFHFSCSVVCDDPMEGRVGGGGKTASAGEGGAS